MLKISNNVSLSEWEIEFSAIRAQGSGGQNVNKVSTAIHLRFDIKRSSLPAYYKEQLLKLSDARVTSEGVVVIKAQSHRSQEKNKQDALERLRLMILDAVKSQKKRVATKPSKGSVRRRLDKKKQHSAKKSNRGKISF